ncbi:rab11 family-interacting protein 1-like [Pseudonaja textilis]|uniref:rab11 family-interacting protein 1-like n=1 Tax=Pseudonaja textilis TaxID=8673 RepID=UPI000EA9657D|nr:rab11 family-interacting protein 1-like [Pseudonaja textilis]
MGGDASRNLWAGPTEAAPALGGEAAGPPSRATSFSRQETPVARLRADEKHERSAHFVAPEDGPAEFSARKAWEERKVRARLLPCRLPFAELLQQQQLPEGPRFRPPPTALQMGFWALQFTGIKTETKGGCEEAGRAQPQEEGWQTLGLAKERLLLQKVEPTGPEELQGTNGEEDFSQTSPPRGRAALGPDLLLWGEGQAGVGHREDVRCLSWFGGVSLGLIALPFLPPRWYKLHSKPGKKEKERGEIQLSLQFTRHSLTASMFDLSVKEKPRSPFRRLRDKMKGKHSYDLDSSSAIVPSSSGALDDDFHLRAPKDKARGSFFFKGQLRRSSLTRSSTSLGSASTLSSASSLAALGSAEGGAPSPSRHSSLSTDPAGNSQPGLPATPELAKDPRVVSEHQGLPPSIQAGEAQPEPLAPPASHLQPSPAAAAAAPVRPPVEGDDGFDAFAASRLQPAALGPEPPPTAEPPGGAAGLPQQEEGPPSPDRVSQQNPDWLSFTFEDRGRTWSGSGGALLARGTFGEGANSVPNASSLPEEQTQGEATQAQSVGQLGSSTQMVPVASEVAGEMDIGWTPESCPRHQTTPSMADRSSEQLDWGREQQMFPRSQPGPQAGSSEPSWLQWDPERGEEGGAEEADPTSGGPAQEEPRVPAQTEVPRGAGTPPPKPARRVPPLQLAEEAKGAGWGARPRGAGPEPHQPLPPEGMAGSPPAAAVSLVPAVIIGASVSEAPEGPPLAAAEDETLEDDKPGAQEASSGGTILAANEGPSAEALPFSTCPSQLSLGGLGLSGVPESPRQDGEAGFAPWGLEEAWPTGLPGSASLWSSERSPCPAEASQGPPELRVEPSPSLLFWSALEEHRGPLGGGASLESPSGLGQKDVAPSHPGQEPEPELPDEQAMEFRKASFWQEGRGQPESMQKDPALTPGNPFTPWALPSPQKNPFVALPAAEVPWAQAATFPVSPTIDALGLGEIPVAANPPKQLRSHSFSVQLPVGPSRPSPRPLAFSTPSSQPSPSPDCHLPSPLELPATSAGAAVDGQPRAPPFPLLSPPSTDASAPSVLPTEMPPAQDAPQQQTASPHPVKPMRSTAAPESPGKERPPEASSPSPIQTAGQEQLTLQSVISGSFAASVMQLEETEPSQSPPTKYHHLTREELLQLLLRREDELGKKEEQVQELEGYIDRLLVRIMEQSPTLLQIPLEEVAKATQ